MGKTLNKVEKKDKQSWKPFFKLIRQVKLPIIGIIFVAIASSVNSSLNVFSTTVMKKLGDGDFSSGNITNFAIITIGIATFTALLRYYSVKVSLILGKRLRGVTVKNILSLKPDYFENNFTGEELITRVTVDTMTISSNVVTLPATLISNVIAIVGFIAVLGSYNVKLIYLLFFNIALDLLYIYINGRFSYRYVNKIQQSLAKLTKSITTTIPALSLIKVFGKEERELQKLNKDVDDYKRKNINFSYFDTGMVFTSSMKSVLQNALVFFMCGFFIRSRTLTLGEFLAYMTAAPGFQGAITSLSTIWLNFKIAAGKSKKVTEIIDAEKEELTSNNVKISNFEDIEFNNVSFSYGNDEVLKGINFIIPKGKMTAIVGPSGSGKTTILNLIEKLYEPQKGEILCGSKNIADFNSASWRRSISYASQNEDITTGTIRENLLYGVNRAVTEEEIMESIKKAHALEFITTMEDGIDAKVKYLGTNLSGGQKQRLTLAREFLKDNNVVLLDEATANVDAESEHYIKEALGEVLKYRTSVVIAHRLSTIMKADQIIVLDSGKVNAIGTHDELYNISSMYKNLVDIEFGLNNKGEEE